MTEDTAKAAPSVPPVNEQISVSEAELGNLGITIKQHTSYHWNGYRYSNAADAVAAAKRASK